MTTTPNPNAQIPFEKLGPAGIRGTLVVLAVMENDTRRDEDRLYDKTPRPFKVLASLGKTHLVAEGLNGNLGPEDGGSYLRIPDNATINRVSSPEGDLEIVKNSRGEKSLVRFECTATSISEARRKFLELALPLLDYLAYLADCPVVVQSIKVDDIWNQAQSLDYISPYRPVVVNPAILEVSYELAPVFAMYREAKNSHSDFYKFLCYHKIIDGLLGTLRHSVRQRARKQKVELLQQRDVVPDAPDIALAFRPYIGKSIKSFFDGVMTPQYRNAIAHFITKDGSILNLSSPANMSRHEDIMYVSELCVRTLIASHQQLVSQLQGKANGG